MRSLSFLLFYFVHLTSCDIYNRYIPPGTAQNRAHRIYVEKFKEVEAVACFGMTFEMINSAKKAILDQYSGIVMNSGVESNEIAKDMEKKYGGYWMVGIFSADFDVAYTITRRSKSYGVFRIDDKMILIAKDGNRKLHFGPVY